MVARALGPGPVLVSAPSSDLAQEAAGTGGPVPTTTAFLAGAVLPLLVDPVPARRGARHRERSGDQQPPEAEQGGSGAAIAVGALLDGVPESVVLGVGLPGGGGVSVAVVVVAVVVVSHVPEGLSSVAGTKRAGRSARCVFGVWSAIALVSGAAAAVGHLAPGSVSPGVVAALTALAAGPSSRRWPARRSPRPSSGRSSTPAW